MIFFPTIIGSASVPMSDAVKNFGVTLDCHLTMKLHISSILRTADFEFRRISSIHHVLSTDTTNILVSASVSFTPRLLQFSPVCQQYLLSKIQTVQNNATRLVLRLPQIDHIIISAACFSPLAAH